MAWTGDPNNPVPNIGNVSTDLSQAVAQNSSNLSEKRADINRAEQVRRDTDKQKDNVIRLIDVDEAIMKQLIKFQLTVVDGGVRVKVPVEFASPEKWKSIQKDGIFRDFNGKIILPLIVLQRTTSEKDAAIMTFNRYLTYTVLKKYSEKNRYTKFSILTGQNTPVHEVFDVVMPDHMILTYHFIVWTETTEQMNEMVEKLNFEAEDYWGDLRGYRFRARVDSFAHQVQLEVDKDRMVKTEFDLMVHAYLLPDIIDTFHGNKDTTQKRFTPKKVIMVAETVMTNFDFNTLDQNQDKIRNQNYPNLPKSDVIEPPPFVVANTLNQPISGSSL